MPKHKHRKICIIRQQSDRLPAASSTVRQIGIKISCPNPLFERWLQEMLTKAEDKDSMSRIPLQKALASLRRYPLPIASGRDCFMLTDFGKTICEALEKRWRVYLKNGGEIRTALMHDQQVEKLLNDESLEFYRSLIGEVHGEGDKEQLTDAEQFEIPDDSIFENLDVLDQQYVTISNPEAILLVDTQETIGKSRSNLDRTLNELGQHQVRYEVRRLSVGDFLWIVWDDGGKEFILPYIVERKRMDDLASSIKDGRFHEQKFRLKQCGLANIIYLIEHLGNNRQVGVPASTLSQAALNTLVQDFAVKYTENHQHTVLYLSVMTKLLNKNIKDKQFWNITNLPQETIKAAASDFSLKHRTIPLISFEIFNKQSLKNRECTVREIFMKQLLQIKLLTIEKVNAIVERYPTAKRLYLAYDKCTSEEEKERMLNLPYGPAKRTIGLKLSKIVYQLFTSDVYQR
ncbi:crossover junction endonuclease MUS81-like [Topomyia yanbarensis]|uniref:crossover junction endonuclease MUS81-like n=1 Tax=Topomyia yanbarensis TaxID=2498891 RepID=UPI00273BA855|nr:crossover junction endonuclease MUS81-like [Topomyia yanbarensis]XP_058815641.1 crossover junction endonuclease MUS81-like [Topomyia yanbarensis]